MHTGAAALWQNGWSFTVHPGGHFTCRAAAESLSSELFTAGLTDGGGESETQRQTERDKWWSGPPGVLLLVVCLHWQAVDTDLPYQPQRPFISLWWMEHTQTSATLLTWRHTLDLTPLSYACFNMYSAVSHEPDLTGLKGLYYVWDLGNIKRWKLFKQNMSSFHYNAGFIPVVRVIPSVISSPFRCVQDIKLHWALQAASWFFFQSLSLHLCPR